MAYIKKEKVAEIRKEIKKVLTHKDGFKISITRENYSGVAVAIMQSPLKLSSDNKQVSDFHIHEMENENEKLIFELIDKAITRVMGACYNRNANDPGADYSDYNFYKWYRIGKWDKPCVFIDPKS